MLKSIPIGDITCLKNYRTIRTDAADFLDLVESVAKDGILQAGLVRENKNHPGKYELIFGNRRFEAAKEAGLEEFPATVKEVADDDVLHYQISENLQRKDVHPVDEAEGFKAYQLSKKCDLKELSAVFAKPERYIARRLALITLSADLKKHFLNGDLTVAQAEVFAKLTADQQKNLKEESFDNYHKTFSDVNSLKRKIERLFLLKMSEAKWDLQDATLVVKAGACSTCKKRTSCNGLLFDDITKDDSCLDGKCFSLKENTWFLEELEKIATTKPKTVFYKNYGDADKAVLDLIKKYGVALYNYSDSNVQSWKSVGYVAIKCFTINGSEKGKYQTIYVRQSAATKVSKDDSSPAAIKMQVDGIKERLKRGKELDFEKEQELIVKELRKIAPDDKLTTVLPMTDLYKGLTLYMLIKLQYMDSDLEELLGIYETEDFGHDENPEIFLQRLISLSDVQAANILKEAMLSKCGSDKMFGASSYFLRQLAVWFGVDVDGIIANQNAVAEKREINATKRIEALNKLAVAEKEGKSAGKTDKPVKAKKTAINKPAAKAKAKHSKKKAA